MLGGQTTHGTRSGIPHIIVHISDGPSEDSNAVLQAAMNAQNSGNIIFNIGIGENLLSEQLAKVIVISTMEWANAEREG